MSDNITVVTAFYDIGRSSWNSYARSNEKYFEYFTNLSRIHNEMIVFTSSEYADRIKNIRGNKPTTVIVLDIFEQFKEELKLIENVHKSDDFKNKIRSDLLNNPEYRCAEYTLVTYCKSYFLYKAVIDKLVKTDLVAWIDFGMCRSRETLHNTTQWRYDFDCNKINVFGFKEVTENIDIENIIANNEIYLIGTNVVLSKDLAILYWELTQNAFNDLLKINMIDDDQSILTYACSQNLDKFVQHRLPEDVWFDLFRMYNKR